MPSLLGFCIGLALNGINKTVEDGTFFLLDLPGGPGYSQYHLICFEEGHSHEGLHLKMRAYGCFMFLLTQKREGEEMSRNDTLDLLEQVYAGKLKPEDALLYLKMQPFEDIDFAKIDWHRKLRQGVPEIIYGAGKTPEQIISISDAMLSGGQKTILITRLSGESAQKIGMHHKLDYKEVCRIGIIGEIPEPSGSGNIAVVTGGTSDIPVAEEAAVTAQALGSEVLRIYDVGVAGLHRLLSRSRELMTAKVIVAIAGMEGALASVVGGLVDCPVIAVPTSVGYGASFNGLAALLCMLNSCASGVSVVNIDNGFGAGYLANMINHL